MKHQVGCAWNEISGRYVELDESFWSPRVWREQSASVKQGSGGALEQSGQIDAHFVYVEAINAAVAAYQRLLQMGVCKEQARAILPVATMSECYWTCSLHALIHFLNQRLDGHAQQEIREYAQAVSELVESVEGLPFILETCLDRS
jgi:thymidylate synthase (FAD)